jgi:hypothetical protein
MLFFIIVNPCDVRKSNLCKKKKSNKINPLFNRYFNDFLKRGTFSVPSLKSGHFLSLQVKLTFEKYFYDK